MLAALPLISHKAMSIPPSAAMICGRWPRGNGGGRPSCPPTHSADNLPELLNETTYQRQRSTLNLAIPTETDISLDFDQDQGRFCADFVRRPTRLRSRDRQGICLYGSNLHARLLRA